MLEKRIRHSDIIFPLVQQICTATKGAGTTEH